MIGFSIMMWFCSALLIFVSFSLLKGNYSSVHGKVFETTNDRKGYAKALGKPVLFDLLFFIVLFLILDFLHAYFITSTTYSSEKAVPSKYPPHGHSLHHNR